MTVYDPGRQPERTRLAWRRTVLALAVAALVALRLLPSALGPVGIGVALAGLVLAAGLWVLAGRRAAHVARALRDPSTPLPDAALLLLLTAAVTSAAALGVLWLVQRGS